MKNTLSITKNDICSCVDSVADSTNSIFVAVDVGNVFNPQCKVWLNDTLKSTVELITNEINYVNLPPDLFIANGVIKFQYLDSAYTGQIFTINFPATLEGNLSVTKTSDYVFTVKYTKSGVVTITIDSELSATSENAVQNKVITKEIIKIKSHIGMVIQTTTLDTMDKVISIYGGTKWVKIEGRMLLGASSIYNINSTGGEATHILTTNELPSHNHIFTGTRSLTEVGGDHYHNAAISKGVAGRNDWGLIGQGAFGGNILLTNNASSTFGAIQSAGSHQHYYTPSGYINNSGGSNAHNNMPPYKVVYIWERTE